ncbi:MAG: hypothetical protein NTZ04_06095 [Chloroflexi bacterium]|nr:hypothetical protein [Chloroflexota bacterium]
MTKVFIGGSRRLSTLSPRVRTKLNSIIHKRYMILVGDANGADKSVQRYLTDKHYNNVMVFCMANGCRNNLGQWETRRVEVSASIKGIDFYSAKDLEMVKEADYGFMLWDGKSRGTLLNIVRLLERDKKTLVYVSPKRTFLTLTTPADVEGLLAKCDEEQLDLFGNRTGMSQTPKKRTTQHQLNLTR